MGQGVDGYIKYTICDISGPEETDEKFARRIFLYFISIIAKSTAAKIRNSCCRKQNFKEDEVTLTAFTEKLKNLSKSQRNC